MNYHWRFLKAHRFGIAVLLIILLAFLLRFYNFENRWGLAYDQGHDVLVARYAIETHKIPLLGPFSSAGPFQTGGEWYWFIMAGVALYPSLVLAPWLFLTAIYVIFVYLMIRLGMELVNKKFGIIVGLLSAFSTAQIAQSTNLTNQAPLAIISLLALWSMVKCIRTRNINYIFLLGFFVSLGPSMHLQGVALIFLALFTFLFAGIPFKKMGLLYLLVGLILPWLPVIISDLSHDFFNFKNMFNYYVYDQYKISLDVLGRRWLTYAGVFWPSAWAHVIGGHIIIGYITIFMVGIVFLYELLKKRISREWYIILASFLCAIIVLRYTRTPLFYSYIVFLHPFIIILTSWAIYLLHRINRSLGMIVLIILLVGSSKDNIAQIKREGNYTSMYIQAWKKTLLTKFPNKKFALYDFKHKTVDKSLPLTLFLDSDYRIDDDGMKIGLLVGANKLRPKREIINGSEGGHQIVNLNSSTSAQLIQDGWVFVNPSAIYKSTEEWHN